MLWVLLLGISTGMRALTAIAVFCWFMWLAMLPVTGLNFWTANIVSVIVFTALALGEYYGDTLPSIPNRTSWFPLLTRVLLGAGVGAMAFSSLLEPLAGGILFGAVGALIGAYGGYEVRVRLARKVGNDFPVAVCESAIALGMSLVGMVMLHRNWVSPAVAMLRVKF
jgi:uncharacterized membrane protein